MNLPTTETAANFSSTGYDSTLPTISFDRALSHYAGYVDVDTDQLQTFYNRLPHANKPPLEQLRVHFSAVRVENGLDETLTGGDFLYRGTRAISRRSRRLTPELEKTKTPTIRVFVGSGMTELYANEGDALQNATTVERAALVASYTTDTLAHELTHYAQLNNDQLAHTNRLKTIKNNLQLLALKSVITLLVQSKNLFVGTGVFGLSEVLTHDTSSSITTGLGATALSYVVNRKQLRKYRAEREYAHYQKSHDEIDAFEHSYGAPPMTPFILRPERIFTEGYGLEDFVKRQDDRLALSVANSKHRDLAYTPLGGNPKEVSKASLLSEFRSIGIRARADRARLKSRSRSPFKSRTAR